MPMPTTPSPHAPWMQRCLDLARRGIGYVSPNPMVGAVLVDPRGEVLGEGWHQRYGGPHAEPHAIAAAMHAHGADALRSATLYVSLEPCSHHGKTPPCADLILKTGIRRVVVGMEDPFPAVAGRGIERLRAAGVDVTVGVLEEACQRLNEAFVHHVQAERPFVTLKVAQTLDGFVATRTGDARWVSGKASRRRVHQWRAEMDGVLVGSGTARADDPALTVRLVKGRQPRRFVLDRTGTLPPTLQLFTDAWASHTTAFIGPGAVPPYGAALRVAGGQVVALSLDADGHLSLKALLAYLGHQGGLEGPPLQSLLIEAGPHLATALLQQHLVDRLALFIAPKLLGDGVPTLYSLGIQQMAQALTFQEVQWEAVGDDLLFLGTLQH